MLAVHFAFAEVLPKRLLKSKSYGKMTEIGIQPESGVSDGSARAFGEIYVAFVGLCCIGKDAGVGQQGESACIFPVKNFGRALIRLPKRYSC